MQKNFVKTVGLSGAIALITLIVAGLILANGAGKFLPPDYMVMLNALITILVATQYKHKPIVWLVLALALIFVLTVVINLQYSGLFIVLHSLINTVFAFFKIIPEKEGG